MVSAAVFGDDNCLRGRFISAKYEGKLQGTAVQGFVGGSG